ncbi:MAG: response regulator [Herpetosiphonaceae bacterium]|nr:response regulator [Herpetosiphonaceae bacterium]
MSKETLLVVEDAPDIQALLKIYFTSQGYTVHTASRGRDALEVLRTSIPDLVLLDVNLPDMLGYDVGRTMRTNPRTRSIPIIFATARGEKADRMTGLGEVEAEAYVVKPFDIELLHLEVKNVIRRAKQKNQTHPVTNLPTADLISEQLRGLLGKSNWALATLRIEYFDAFTQGYGASGGEEVMKFVALLLTDTVRASEQPDTFIGQASTGPEWTVLAHRTALRSICDAVVKHFDSDIRLHYNYRDRKNGSMTIANADGSPQQVPLMSLAAGILDSDQGPFYDLRELTETAETIRQMARLRVLATGKSSISAA